MSQWQWPSTLNLTHLFDSKNSQLSLKRILIFKLFSIRWMKVFLYCSNIGVAKWQYFIFRLHSENFSFSIFDSQFAIFESIVDDLGTKWMINRGQTGRLNDRKWTVISPSILFDRLVLLKTVRFPRKIFSNYFLLLGLSEIISTLQLRSILSNYPLSECDPFTEFSLLWFSWFLFQLVFSSWKIKHGSRRKWTN